MGGSMLYMVNFNSFWCAFVFLPEGTEYRIAIFQQAGGNNVGKNKKNDDIDQPIQAPWWVWGS